MKITKTFKSYWNMKETDLVIHKFDANEQECFIFTSALPGMHWPAEIEITQGKFKYEGNWGLPSEHSGNYLGYARYIKIA